ncbi:hypothetical protein MIR68_012688 [Amoeboaphelidium protococcarum]|nr:hypothetical protein MIR68_012688 [Amoeboaphelidium protococcarum]
MFKHCQALDFAQQRQSVGDLWWMLSVCLSQLELRRLHCQHFTLCTVQWYIGDDQAGQSANTYRYKVFSSRGLRFTGPCETALKPACNVFDSDVDEGAILNQEVAVTLDLARTWTANSSKSIADNVNEFSYIVNQLRERGIVKSDAELKSSVLTGLLTFEDPRWQQSRTFWLNDSTLLFHEVMAQMEATDQRFLTEFKLVQSSNEADRSSSPLQFRMFAAECQDHLFLRLLEYAPDPYGIISFHQVIINDTQRKQVNIASKVSLLLVIRIETSRQQAALRIQVVLRSIRRVRSMEANEAADYQKQLSKSEVDDLDVCLEKRVKLNVNVCDLDDVEAVTSSHILLCCGVVVLVTLEGVRLLLCVVCIISSLVRICLRNTLKVAARDLRAIYEVIGQLAMSYNHTAVFLQCKARMESLVAGIAVVSAGQYVCGHPSSGDESCQTYISHLQENEGYNNL